MKQQQVEELVSDLEDWMFEISRLVRKGFYISPEAVSFLANLHPILDKMSEELCEDEHAWNEEQQSEAEENNAYLTDALQAVRAEG
tara:strand:- start:44 stop:301 length:258 start_codon:yes stop_codon:yes gene_type:complete